MEDEASGSIIYDEVSKFSELRSDPTNSGAAARFLADTSDI